MGIEEIEMCQECFAELLLGEGHEVFDSKDTRLGVLCENCWEEKTIHKRGD